MGAFEESQTLNSLETKKRFFINRDLETELGVVVSFVHYLYVQGMKNGCEAERLAVRLEFDIPHQEKEYLKKRKPLVGQTLQKLLGLSSPPESNKMPTIALVGSGGGTRAMIGLLGSLRGLKELGVLDAVTYITGVSGSTWTMSSLYQDANWSHEDMNSIISAVKEKMTKPILSCFSTDKLSYYKEELTAKGNDGYLVSLIDMWGLVIEHLVFEKKTENTLSEQQRTVNEGQNPFPIYTAVNMKDGIKGCEAEAETHPDAFPSKLTPSDSTLHLVDSGHSINISCAPVMRPERDVDIIICLSYSWDPHIFNVISKTAAFCKDHNMPFPNADFASLEKEPKKEMYVFEDKENPEAPVVIHFPLSNVTYKEFKAPGVPRKTEEEIKAGQVDVSSSESPYTTSNLTYSKEDFQALVNLSTYNIINNKESILETIRKVTKKKKASKKVTEGE
ncbi:hypothetical protein LDENG_00040870 [Lucifuga dentata]|nr:hypothetical protein LDENG_00040870 [Lucifuga dentata]